MNGFSLRKQVRRIRAIPKMLRDGKVRWTKKALVIFGIIYLLLPVDLIPPVLFPVGFVDDLVLWVYIVAHLGDILDQYDDYDKEGDLSGKYRRKDLVEDVNFDVNEDINEDEESGQWT